MTTSTSDNLVGPADLIAALPGILGFYPHESTILLGLCSDSEGPLDSVTLGPVLRADLTHTPQLLSVAGELAAQECFAFYAVIVTRIPESTIVGETQALLFDATSATGLHLVDACWHVSEIATGTPYSLMFGPGRQFSGSGELSENFFRGSVSSVMSSPAMGALREDGSLPELDRDHTFTYFDPAPADQPYAVEDRVALARVAQTRSLALERLLDLGEPGGEVAVEHARELLRSAPPGPLIRSDRRFDPEALPEEDDQLAVATLLCTSKLRDLLISTAVDNPLPAGAALLRISKTFPGVIRANALCIWAFIAAERGLASWATAAAAAALREVPEHTMSCYFIWLMRSGNVSTMLQAAKDGVGAHWEPKK
ncbi:hypothetical protein CAPI_04835 [Corynebacterium capitovis DSM 44611]|uniref:DUF4192 domain-containing protein n=1 Tax=Corynebacterium capitovis TaxID=131081 RepID=UPI0003628667|nr:DUF4192 domain-containing protein [Corynebacterium capitovis]WKD57525.1 hypothetical protein CAPI_04835 [Corynebacterium capitovis DSM 44611]